MYIVYIYRVSQQNIPKLNAIYDALPTENRLKAKMNVLRKLIYIVLILLAINKKTIMLLT